MNSVHTLYPDDDSEKEVYVQANGLSFSGVGDRHLTGGVGGYGHYSPFAEIRPSAEIKHELFVLGKFSRAQRDETLKLARDVVLVKASRTNNCCVWTRDLLGAMLGARLISQAAFAAVDAGRWSPTA
ncbi:hypothetical protein HETIRDRAFT_107006 [Heterobasidion irregulare TC 32-1]|uniref:Uncharacterized protein n=1 Tax=Heterobasidion irregulare (strain TC 32-1) TaxID=747525 RepID=W4KBY1_HETIT|nr:uncharacterized protein HETIRDRAFT_107006 [Heterobasidion irregulare TC 32-1]ETW82835.1 hypothetical protein HETIRDRAFT_107006 [Heterobasidion irregulare TC 32-1]